MSEHMTTNLLFEEDPAEKDRKWAAGEFGRPTEYTQEKADIVIATLEEGLRAYTAAQRAGVHRTTIFNWRKNFPEFAMRWDAAVASATDRVEEIIYQHAVNGDLAACMYWLRNHRPGTYDKATLAKLGMLRAAWEKGNMVIDADGIPHVARQPGTQVYIPDNGRGDRVIDVKAEQTPD